LPQADPVAAAAVQAGEEEAAAAAGEVVVEAEVEACQQSSMFSGGHGNRSSGTTLSP